MGDEDTIQVDQVPDDDDFEAVEKQYEEEDQPIDGEKEYQLVINGGKKQKIEEEKFADEQEDENSQNENEVNDLDQEFDEDLIGKKRKRTKLQDGNQFDLDKKQLRQEKIDNYYCGTSYGN